MDLFFVVADFGKADKTIQKYLFLGAPKKKREDMG